MVFQPKEKNQTSESLGSPGSTGSGSTDITSTGKFTTANFRETTITSSPANLFSHEDKKEGKESSTGEFVYNVKLVPTSFINIDYNYFFWNRIADIDV